MPKATVAPEYLTIPEIHQKYLPLCRQTLQKIFVNQPGVIIHGRREDADRRKIGDSETWRKHRKLFVPRVVVERVMREMTVTR